MYLFRSFYCIMALAKTSGIMLHWVEGADITCFTILEGRQSFTIKCNVRCFMTNDFCKDELLFCF